MSTKTSKFAAMKPRIVVIGVGGGGGNAVNNMLAAELTGPKFIVANTDAQALELSGAEHRIQLGARLTEGIGAGAKHEIGEAAAEEALEEIREALAGAHMVFIAAGMGGGTGTGAAPVIARVAKQEFGILTVGVVTKPFLFEGKRRMRVAEAGINELKRHVDTLLVIPNQNLFKVATERTSFADAFVLADQVLYSGVACIVDLVVKDGLINLDLADVRTVLSGMGTAMMGTGEAKGEDRAAVAAREAIHNPLLEDVVLRGARSLLLSISGGSDLTLFEVDAAVDCIREELDGDANIIFGATLDEALEGRIRVSIVASGMPRAAPQAPPDWPVSRPRSVAPIGGPGVSNDFRHVLSRAMSTSEPHDAEGMAPGGQWRTPGGDVVIREGPPQLPGQSPPASSHARGRGGPAGGGGAWGRHVPGIGEFPLVAQREYLAKAGDVRKGASQPPSAYEQQHEAPAPRTSLLQRLRGGGRDKRPQAEAHRPVLDEGEEDPDVPPFLRPGPTN